MQKEIKNPGSAAMLLKIVLTGYLKFVVAVAKETSPENWGPEKTEEEEAENFVKKITEAVKFFSEILENDPKWFQILAELILINKEEVEKQENKDFRGITFWAIGAMRVAMFKNDKETFEKLFFTLLNKDEASEEDVNLIKSYCNDFMPQILSSLKLKDFMEFITALNEKAGSDHDYN